MRVPSVNDAWRAGRDARVSSRKYPAKGAQAKRKSDGLVGQVYVSSPTKDLVAVRWQKKDETGTLLYDIEQFSREWELMKDERREVEGARGGDDDRCCVRDWALRDRVTSGYEHGSRRERVAWRPRRGNRRARTEECRATMERWRSGHARGARMNICEPLRATGSDGYTVPRRMESSMKKWRFTNRRGLRRAFQTNC